MVVRSSIWGSLILFGEIQSSESGVCLAVDGDLVQEGGCKLQKGEGQLVLRWGELFGLGHLA